MIGGLIIITGAIAVVAISFVLYEHTVNLLTTNLRQRIEGIARTAAPFFSPSDIKALTTESDWQKPEWHRVTNQLLAVEKSNEDILFAYIFRKRPSDSTLMEFVADSHSVNPYANTDTDPSNDVDANKDGLIEPDGPDYLQWPGQDYEDPPEGTFRSYEVGPTTSNELYEDSFGRVITGYAPIKENGETIAVLAFDMKADDFFSITQQTLYPFAVFISVLILIILVLFYLIIRLWSRRLKVETSQREQIEKLLKELGKSNDKLWVANEKLKDLDKQKTEFVSIASHQLRSPLTAIKGYSSMVLEGSFGEISDKVREAVDRVFQSSQRLVLVIEDFLNISRIELGTMKYEWSDFDLREVVETVVRETRHTVEKNGLKLFFEYDTNLKYVVHGDLGKISQVVSNMLDNAMKYTKQGSIKVMLEKKVGKVRFAVKDTGIGIGEETMPKLFEKFSRASDAGKTNIAGTGLGLYVAKEIVTAHKGKIWAESEGVGKGSTFIVEI